MNGRSFFKLINLTFEWYIKENLRIHHDNNLLKNMVLKFEFELVILDDFRKVSKSKIGVPLRVPFWAGVRLVSQICEKFCIGIPEQGTGSCFLVRFYRYFS